MSSEPKGELQSFKNGIVDGPLVTLLGSRDALIVDDHESGSRPICGRTQAWDTPGGQGGGSSLSLAAWEFR